MMMLDWCSLSAEKIAEKFVFFGSWLQPSKNSASGFVLKEDGISEFQQRLKLAIKPMLTKIAVTIQKRVRFQPEWDT